MTLSEAISRVDALKPNRFTEAQKLAWLSAIEGQIFNEIVSTHDNPDAIGFSGYTQDTASDTQLIAPFPYDEVYLLYLQAQIDLGNMEIAKYNNSKTLFNNAYITLQDFWNRGHMPKQKVKRFDFG